MTTHAPASDAAPARPELFDKWTRRGLLAALVPLLGWDAASVFSLATAAHITAHAPVMPTAPKPASASAIPARPCADLLITSE